MIPSIRRTAGRGTLIDNLVLETVGVGRMLT